MTTQKLMKDSYLLEEQVGFILRQVSQRHAALFMARMGEDITPMQWAAMAKLHEVGPTSQNLLGRMTAMDAATIKGVVDRLMKREFIGTTSDALDARRRLIALTDEGRAFVLKHYDAAFEISRETVAPLEPEECKTFIRLLEKLR